jgi:hypothetical protein
VTCADCKRTLEVGDHYIKFTFTEWQEREGLTPVTGLDDLMAQVMGSDNGDDIIYCEDCTVRGGDYLLEMVYGDEDA